MPRRSPAVGLLAAWIVVVLAAAATAALRRGDEPTTTPAATTSTTAPARGVALRGDQATVVGAVDSGEVLGALTAAVALPITLDSAARGFGNGAEIRGVTVDGEPATIVWDAGRPFVLSGDGSLHLDPVRFVVAGNAVTAVLGGAVHRLGPGTYRLDTPVAVGRSGVATPRDSVTFTAGDEATVAADGDVSLVLGVGPHPLVGPGRLALAGDLTVTTAEGARRAASIALADGGFFELTLSPGPDGRWAVEALVQGDFSVT